MPRYMPMRRRLPAGRYRVVPGPGRVDGQPWQPVAAGLLKDALDGLRLPCARAARHQDIAAQDGQGQPERGRERGVPGRRPVTVQQDPEVDGFRQRPEPETQRRAEASSGPGASHEITGLRGADNPPGPDGRPGHAPSAPVSWRAGEDQPPPNLGPPPKRLDWRRRRDR